MIMAASSMPSQKGEEFKEQFLTCSICYESFDNGEHQAKLLPCLHTFCLSCLKSHAGKRPNFNCPQCRKGIFLLGGTVDSLQNNFLVGNLREYQDIVDLTVCYGSCNDGGKAASFCHDCGCVLCQECVHIHEKIRPLRHHRRSTIQEFQQQKHHPRNKQVCQKHPTQNLNLYCKDAACKVPVCASCGHGDHRGHELVDLTAAFDKVTAEIKQFSVRVNGKAGEIAKTRETVETDQKNLTRNTEQNIKDINELEIKLIKQVKSKFSQATTHITKLCETEMKNLSSKIESIDNLTFQMTSACEFANKACDLNNPTQLLTSHYQIKERLKELENAYPPETTSDKTDFTFTENHQSALTQIQESVQHLCDITWIQKTEISAAQTKSNNVKADCGTTERKNKTKPAATESKPNCIDPKQCTILQFPYHIRGWKKAIVQAVDTNGQLMTTGGALVEASQGGVVFITHDNQDGTYIFDYNIFWGHLHVTINGTPIRGSLDKTQYVHKTTLP